MILSAGKMPNKFIFIILRTDENATKLNLNYKSVIFHKAELTIFLSESTQDRPIPKWHPTNQSLSSPAPTPCYLKVATRKLNLRILRFLRN